MLERVNRDSYDRQFGRYWATDVYKIRKGYLTPKNFFSHNKIDLLGARRILTGIIFEDGFQKLLSESNTEFEYQAKKVIPINDFELVVKPDFVFPNFLIETKYSFSPIRDKIPVRYLDQLECEYRAFEKDVILGVFSVPFNITFLTYTPSKGRWNGIKKVLTDFHSKLKLQNNVQQKP